MLGKLLDMLLRRGAGDKVLDARFQALANSAPPAQKDRPGQKDRPVAVFGRKAEADRPKKRSLG